MDYKTSGVDIEAGYKSVELMKEYVKETMRAEVLGGLGGFSGAFSLAKIKEMEEPVLLSGTDGCGTKVKLAMVMDKHDTIGIDAVAMCVNDIACAGGEPLFFLDYIVYVNDFHACILACLKHGLRSCGVIWDINESVDSACDHIINLGCLFCRVILGIKVNQFAAQFVTRCLNTV